MEYWQALQSFVDSKSFVFFDDSLNENRIMGFMVDNQYGIEKNAK